jgi:hypothetical protein
MIVALELIAIPIFHGNGIPFSQKNRSAESRGPLPRHIMALLFFGISVLVQPTISRHVAFSRPVETLCLSNWVRAQ